MDRLKVKRAARRTQATKIANEATALLESGCDDRTAFRKVTDKLVAIREELRKINSEIEDAIPIEDLEREYESAALYDDQTLETLTRLQCRLEDLSVGGAVHAPASTALNTPLASTTTAPQNVGPRLPTLTIKPFYGDVCQWTSFWEQFNGAVHTNQALSATDRFQYLRSYLVGEAAAAIAGLPTTEACYESAIQLLKERFGDKSRIIQRHFRALRELQHVAASSDIKELRRLYDCVQQNVRCLNVLDVPTSNFSAMLYDVLLEALPKEIVLAFHRHGRLQEDARGATPVSAEATTTSCQKLEQLLRYMRIELETREQCTPSTPSVKSSGYRKKHMPSSSVLHASEQSRQDREGCFFCKSKKHETEACSAALTMVEKKKRLAKAMRCYRCTRPGHRANECRRKLGCATCKGRHASTMCHQSARDEATRGQKINTDLDATKPMNEDRARSTAVTSCHLDEAVNLQTFRSWIVGSKETSYVRGIFDGGSQRTFVREDLVARLGLKIIRETRLAVNTFASHTPSRVRSCKVVEVRLRSQFDDNEHIIEAIAMPVICHDIPATDMESAFVAKLREQSYRLADDLTVPRGCGEKGISLLVGSDQLWKVVSGDIIRSTEVQGLVAIKTTLGWTLQGPAKKTSFVNGTSEVMICVLRVQVEEAERSEHSLLESFWSLDAMGIAPNEATHANADTLPVFQDKITKIGTRYQVAVPCKEPDIEHLQDNYGVALNRLRNLVRRISKPEGLLERYDTAIRQYIISGHAEVVPDKEAVHGHAYYMPHREVIREDSLTTKLRVVFDASSHAKGEKSLNSCLETGPNLNPDLLQVLLRFRFYLIPMTADIEKAFLQVEIRKEDRDLFRFLWFHEKPTVPFNEESLEVWRMTRVPFGSTASSFMLTATIQHHLKTQVPPDKRDVARLLLKSFYVDDLLFGADDLEAAASLYKSTKELMDDAGMPLRKWSSSCRELEQVFDLHETHASLGKENVGSQSKVLGMGWSKETDAFIYNPGNILTFLEKAKDTKRFVLQTVSRVYDPLGFLAPYVVRGKMLFQQLWVLKVDWDEELPVDVADKWHEWRNELIHMPKINVPRHIKRKVAEPSDMQLHVFVDASTKAYGACAYLRIEDLKGTLASTLIVAKSRIAPLKALSLPRLELMGALIGSRLLKYIMETCNDLIPGVRCFMWTDSTIVLGWLQKASSSLDVFVKNRVKEILSCTPECSWRHCPGATNPADILTRGVSLDALATDVNWWQGPAWLSKDSSEWPVVERPVLQNDVVSCMKVATPTTLHATGSTVRLAPLLDTTKFSSLHKLLRVTAWVQRFVSNIRCKKRQAGVLSAEEILAAERYWIRQVQTESFPEEKIRLQEGQGSSSNSWLAQLHPFFDEEGLLRVGGRLQNLSGSRDLKHPLLLPSRHRFTELLFADAHRRVMHGGVTAMIHNVRERFWVPRARQAAKRAINQCLLCARFRAKPIVTPYPPLPVCRVERTKPFDTTGLDFAGPLYARSSEGSDRKTYIVLFTCAVTRALHLELASDMSTPAFLLAFRRFIARRGLPSTIYSDNALTFKRASRELQKVWKVIRQGDFQDYFANQRIKWKFIVEAAPWWGGWWERLVGTVKMALRKVLGRSCLCSEELSTILTEIEAVLNSRPLTYSDNDASEPVAITPAHFLVGQQLTTLPEAITLSEKITSNDGNDCRRRFQHRQKMMEDFWKRWKHEYLLLLPSAHRSPALRSTNLKVGDIVVVDMPNTPKLFWPLARVEEVYPGPDGLVRACLVRLQGGKVFRRPVQKLHRLELDAAALEAPEDVGD